MATLYKTVKRPVKYPLLIFDWDGTLSDSTAKIVDAMTLAIHTLSYPSRSAESIRQIIGLGLPEAVKSLYPEAPSDEQRALIDQFIVYHRANRDEPPFYPNVLDVLRELKRAGYILCVATGKSRVGLDRLLDYHDLHSIFTASRCADETLSKPHPRMLLELLEQTQHSVQHALMIGDTTFDLAMAQSIDMARIGVSFGAHSVDQLKCHEPLFIANNFQSISDWLLP